MPGVLPVKREVDVRLEVLNTRADGKWLGDKLHAAFVQHSERVVGGVTHSQSQRSAGEIRAVYADTLQPAAAQLHALQRREESHLAAQAYHTLPEIPDDAAQPVGADVGLRLGEYLLRGAEFRQALQYPGAQRVVYPGRELAVRECPGAALAELHVRGAVQRAAVPVALHRGDTAVHVRTALQYHRLIAEFAQREGTEHSCRTESGYIDVPTELLAAALHHKFPRLVQAYFRALFRNTLFALPVLQPDIHRVDEAHLPARVHGAFVQPRFRNIPGLQPERRHRPGYCVLLRLVQSGLYL